MSGEPFDPLVFPLWLDTINQGRSGPIPYGMELCVSPGQPIRLPLALVPPPRIRVLIRVVRQVQIPQWLRLLESGTKLIPVVLI